MEFLEAVVEPFDWPLIPDLAVAVLRLAELCWVNRYCVYPWLPPISFKAFTAARPGVRLPVRSFNEARDGKNPVAFRGAAEPDWPDEP